MTEDNFEEFLKKTAQGYNAPPARVPRDEMWNEIQAKRGDGPRVVYGGGLATRGASEKSFGSRLWLGIAAAALLLVATGVGIGRWTAAPNTPAKMAKAVQPRPAVVDRGPQSVNPNAGEGSRNATQLPAVASNRSAQGDRGTNGTQVATNETRTLNDSPSSAYQLTAVRHLSEAEALLTSFRARSTADQQMDAQLGAWARQLLSNTRLLLDSPVANDPQRRPLLEDLELVLVQIVQLSPGSTPQDRELIEKSLQQDHVMTRLRTAIPAGSQRGG
jgi:hypothetical protein